MRFFYLLFTTAILTFGSTIVVFADDGGSTSEVNMTPIFLAFILALSIFLGFELIAKVPATLHTPLMSGSNAISGITLVGSLIAAGQAENATVATILGTAAVAFATINVIGGYMVTDRMLEMFKKKDDTALVKQ